MITIPVSNGKDNRNNTSIRVRIKFDYQRGRTSSPQVPLVQSKEAQGISNKRHDLLLTLLFMHMIRHVNDHDTMLMFQLASEKLRRIRMQCGSHVTI